MKNIILKSYFFLHICQFFFTFGYGYRNPCSPDPRPTSLRDLTLLLVSSLKVMADSTSIQFYRRKQVQHVSSRLKQQNETTNTFTEKELIWLQREQNFLSGLSHKSKYWCRL